MDGATRNGLPDRYERLVRAAEASALSSRRCPLVWRRCSGRGDLYLSVLCVGEVRRGIEGLRRRDPVQAQQLEQRLERLEAALGPRVLPVTAVIAERWGCLNVPDPLPVVDGLLAATAIEHGLVLVTRNVRDVERTGVELLNPFEIQVPD